MRKHFKLIRTANWQLSFSCKFCRFQIHFPHVVCTKARPCTSLLFIWKWIILTLCFIWTEENSNVFNPWNPFFQRACFLGVRLLDDAWSILRKISLALSNLSKVTPATLLKSISVIVNFLASFQEIKKTVLKAIPLSVCFSNVQMKQVCLWWERYLLFLITVTKGQLLKNFQEQIVCRQVDQR